MLLQVSRLEGRSSDTLSRETWSNTEKHQSIPPLPRIVALSSLTLSPICAATIGLLTCDIILAFLAAAHSVTSHGVDHEIFTLGKFYAFNFRHLANVKNFLQCAIRT